MQRSETEEIVDDFTGKPTSTTECSACVGEEEEDEKEDRAAG
jgi:hypothetical protein